MLKNAAELTMPWLHFFLYGDTGAGKTEAAATFPRPIFLVPQNENSIATLAGRDIPYIEITGQHGEIVNGRGGLDAALRMLEDAYAKDMDNFPFDTIVVESLTHYTDLVQEEITQGNTKPMDQRGWGLLAQHIRNVQRRLRSLDVHVIFTALAKVDQDAAGVATGLPMLPGQSALKLPSACDVIGYCEAGRGKKPNYKIHFRRHGHFPARSRFRNVPPVIENFTFEQLEPFLSGNPTTEN